MNYDRGRIHFLPAFLICRMKNVKKISKNDKKVLTNEKRGDKMLNKGRKPEYLFCRKAN